MTGYIAMHDMCASARQKVSNEKTKVSVRLSGFLSVCMYIFVCVYLCVSMCLPV